MAAEDETPEDFWIGADPRQQPAELRYQRLGDMVYTIQLFPDGSVARGQLTPAEVSFHTPNEGWYNWDGEFMGADPGLSDY